MATNSFQAGMQSGAALFAPFAQAQAQVNQLRIAQQQELARRLFNQQQLNQQLAARQAISNNELAARREISDNELSARREISASDQAARREISTSDQAARERLQNAQQLFAAQQAEEDRLARANEREAERDFLFNQNQEKQDQAFREQQDRIAQNTDVASAIFGRLNDTTNQLRDKLSITDAEREAALANAIQLTGADAKRTRGEDFAAFFTRVSNDNPEVAAQFQVELQGLQQQKAADPEVLALQSQGRTLGNIFENVTRGGQFDPSFLFTQNQQGQGATDPMAALADIMNASLNQSQQAPSQPASGTIPATPGLFVTAPRVISEGVGGAIQGIGGLVEDARRRLFGQPEVSESDITDTKQFAESIGVTGQEFDLLSNDEKRELNQRRIKSNASKQAPKKPSSFVPIFGF